MTVDFFNADCTHHLSDEEFGLCDREDGFPAYASVSSSDTWVATVSNPKGEHVAVTALDGCVKIMRQDGSMERRCDLLLRYRVDHLDLVELKNQSKNWISDGVKQLRVTIGIFQAHHDATAFIRKRAILANRRHPNFQFGHKAEMQSFHHQTGFRLLIEATIRL